MERIIKSCKNLRLKPLSAILFLVLSLITSSGLSFFTPYQVNAISDYDSVVTTTDTLQLLGDSCSIAVPYEGLEVDLINNDDLWDSTPYASSHETLKTIWSEKVTYAVSLISWTGTNRDILVTATSGEDTELGFQIAGGVPTAGITGYQPGDYYFQAIFSTNSSCSTLTVSFASVNFTSGTDYQPIIDDTRPVYSNSLNVVYPEGYEGLLLPGTTNQKTQVYPGISITVEDNGTSTDTSKVTLAVSDEFYDWLITRGLQNEDYYTILTLTTMSDEIIVADRCYGPVSCVYNQLALGDYKARMDVVFSNEDIMNEYQFNTTEVWFQVNNTSYSMFYNPNENKYCTVKNGWEWNCNIPQPGQEPEIITGDPETWTPEDCTIDGFPWVDLNACIRNIMHYLGEYLGINGPTITSSSSPFFQFDSNTFGLTSIITAPVEILNNLAVSEYLCNPVYLPLPNLDSSIELPCMNNYYTTYLDELYDVWQLIISGIISYYVIVGILKMVKDSKDPQKDKIEVLKL